MHGPEAQLEERGPDWQNRPEDPTAADRIIDLFVAPARAFSGLLAARNLNSVIGVGALLLILLSFGTTVLVTSSELFAVQQEERLEQMVDRYSEMEGVSDDDLEEVERGFASQSEMSVLMAFVSSLFSVPLMLLILGAIVFAVAKIYERGSETYIRYVHALGVATLGIIPMMALAFLLGALQFVGGVDSSMVGLKALVPDGNIYLRLFASAFTLPSILGIVLVGIGTAEIARTRSLGPIVTYAGALMILMALIAFVVSQFPFIEPMISF